MAKDYLKKIIEIEIDRPIGSKHPKYGDIYPVNYGYIPGTKAADGRELDAYLLGVDKPVKRYVGKVIAIIHRIDDNEDKLVVVPEDMVFSDKDIEKIVHFQEQYFDHEIFR